MRILFFSQFYTPESIAPSFRATENSRLWKQMGHDVTVFTGYPNYPAGKIFDGYTPKMLSEEYIGGIRVLRSKLFATPNTNVIRRLKNALSYFVFGWFNITVNRKTIGKEYDVVLGTSGIIFNAFLAQIYASRNHIPFVFEIRDITFVQMQATGKREDSPSVKLMKKLELYLCRKASTVVVVTKGFRSILVENGVQGKKIKVITNGVDIDKKVRAYEDRKQFVLSYFGTLGLSQNIINTFDYADVINEYVRDIKYLIIGEGAKRSEIEDRAINTPYAHLLHGMSYVELEPYYNETQLSIVTLRKMVGFSYTIPSKLFQAMGRGIAVLFIGPDGECADIIREYNAGIVLTGTKEEDLIKLRHFFGLPDWQGRLKHMGENGRRAVEEKYDRSKLAKLYISVFDDVRNK